MSLMDLFKTQGEVGPSPDSSRGNLKDWFLNMKGRRPFGRTARPDPDAKRGDWVDWFLNRRGLAGKFGGSERYQLFQRGGSVNPFEETARAGRGIGGGRDISGPRTRTPLRPRERDTINQYNYETELTINPEQMKGDDEGIFNTINKSILQGIPGFKKTIDIYNWMDKNPYLPDNINIGRRTLGYEFEPEVFGGELDINFGYDFNEDYPYGSLGWAKTFNRGGLMSLV